MSEESSEQPAEELSQEMKALKELQDEYLKLCAQAGQIQFQRAAQLKDLFKINVRIRKINTKALPIHAALKAKSEAK